MQEVLNDLFDYNNLKIYQYVEGFKFSLDSILLAEYVNIGKKTASILDLCTGNGVIPLILSTKTNAKIDAFEIQKEIYELALKSVKYNKLEKNINIYNASIKDIDKVLRKRKYDIITCNPPYFKVDKNSNINKNQVEAIARHEILITLEEIFEIAKNHLNDGGEFYLVHRVERLDEIIVLGKKYNLGVKNVELIKTKENIKPTIVLVKCIKNAKWGIKINNPKNIERLVTYQNMFKEDQ